jgi:GNAT superfamily N-acetyltransferase
VVDRFAETFPAAAHVALGFDGTEGTTADLGWFAAHGFAAEAQTVMTATEVREPRRINHDAVYRPLHSDDDWAQSVELRIRCHDQQLPSAADYRGYITAKAQTNRALASGRGPRWLVGRFPRRPARQPDGPVVREPRTRPVQSVETDPHYRRRGLGGSLVHHVSRYGYDDLAARTLVMVADPDYFAIDLYRAVGFVAAEAQLQIERPPSERAQRSSSGHACPISLIGAPLMCGDAAGPCRHRTAAFMLSRDRPARSLPL